MKKIILISIFILTLLMLVGCETTVDKTPPTQTAPTQKTTPTKTQQPPTVPTTPTEPEGKLSADKVDIIPDISISECLTQIKQTNPDMSDQDANDNCFAVEAVNKEDKSLCDKIVNTDIKSACLAQFG